MVMILEENGEKILGIGDFEDGTYYAGRDNYFGLYGGREGIENKRGCGKFIFYYTNMENGIPQNIE